MSEGAVLSFIHSLLSPFFFSSFWCLLFMISWSCGGNMGDARSGLERLFFSYWGLFSYCLFGIWVFWGFGKIGKQWILDAYTPLLTS